MLRNVAHPVLADTIQRQAGALAELLAVIIQVYNDCQLPVKLLK
jgi:hypothetical protein